MKVIQAGQVFIQYQLLDRLLSSDSKLHAPELLKLLASSKTFRSIPARIVGIGVRPEHIRVTESV